MSQSDKCGEYGMLKQEKIEAYEKVLENSFIGKVFNTFDSIIDFIFK